MQHPAARITPGGPRSKGGKETDISKRSIYPGLKSPHTDYSSMKRKGSALPRGRVRNSRVSVTSPKRKRTNGGLVSRRHSLVNVEARLERTDRVIKVGMAANALFCDRGRPLTVLGPKIIERPDLGISVEGSRGITERESRSNAVRGVGWTHSSDEDRADEAQNLRFQKSAGGDCERRKPGPAKES